MKAPLNRAGLSLVELLVAVMVLTIGSLGMAAGTNWVLRMAELARLDTQRAIAMQSAIEEVKSMPLASVGSGSADSGNFTTTWSVVSSDATSATVQFVLVGPGRNRSAGIATSISASASDTLVYTRVR
jgi:Tfp pilus assembly protein PilV